MESYLGVNPPGSLGNMFQIDFSYNPKESLETNVLIIGLRDYRIEVMERT